MRLGIGAGLLLAVLGSDLFGDQVNLVNGGLSFSITDISVPGNSSLPVALTRTFAVTDRTKYLTNDEPLADWDLDLPRLSGVFAPNWPDARCTVAQAPPAAGMYSCNQN